MEKQKVCQQQFLHSLSFKNPRRWYRAGYWKCALPRTNFPGQNSATCRREMAIGKWLRGNLPCMDIAVFRAQTSVHTVRQRCTRCRAVSGRQDPSHRDLHCADGRSLADNQKTGTDKQGYGLVHRSGIRRNQYYTHATTKNLVKYTVSLPPTLLAILALSLMNISLFLTKSLHCPNLVILTFVNFVVFVRILISRQLVPSPPPLFTLYLITATLSTSIFLSFKQTVSSLFRILLLDRAAVKSPNHLISHLFSNLSNSSKLMNELITRYSSLNLLQSCLV